MPIVVFLFFLLLLKGINKSDHAIGMNLKNSNALRGICAIEIMIGHIGLPIYTNNIFLYPFRKAGILIVGVFFLLSGYGLVKQSLIRDNYFDHFLKKRISTLMIPVLVVYTFSLVIQQRFQEIINIKSIFTHINWYVFEILIFYIVFYALYNPSIKLSKNKANVCLISASILFIIIAFFLKIDDPWYGSTLCFPLGIVYAQYEEQINLKLKKNYCKGVLTSSFALLIGGGVFFILGDEYFIANVIARNICSLSFCILTILILLKVSLGNRVSLFLGSISYEIFLIHFEVLYIMKFLIPYSEILYVVLCISITIVSAFFLHKLLEKIKR